MLQAPQFRLSELVLVQTPEQICWPEAQDETQLPDEQAWAAPQGLLQAPQFKGSFWMLVQTPEQAVRPVPQVDLQAPPVQTPVVQALEQLPQFRLSVEVLVQAVPHSV